MPITKRQFDLGIDEDIQSWMQKIYALLSTDRGLAYSFQEIQETLLHDAFQVQTLERLNRALDVLVEIGAQQSIYFLHPTLDILVCAHQSC